MRRRRSSENARLGAGQIPKLAIRESRLDLQDSEAQLQCKVPKCQNLGGGGRVFVLFGWYCHDRTAAEPVYICRVRICQPLREMQGRLAQRPTRALQAQAGRHAGGRIQHSPYAEYGFRALKNLFTSTSKHLLPDPVHSTHFRIVILLPVRVLSRPRFPVSFACRSYLYTKP